jgi:hypothetical protein
MVAPKAPFAKRLILKNESPATHMHAPEAIAGRGRRPAIFFVKLIV